MVMLNTFNNFLRRKYIISSWVKKKRVWRYSIFFKIICWLLSIGLIYTGTIRLLLDREIYNNQMCTANSIMSVKRNYLVMIIFVCIIGCINFIFSRLTHLYSNYTNSEFFTLGKYCTVIGFLIKYISWFLSLTYIAWFSFIIVNAITIFSYPEEWCSPRYNIYGIDAVHNCLLTFYKNTGCEIAKGLVDIDSADSCNDFNVLKVYSFLYLVRSSPKKECSLEDKNLCDVYVQLLRKAELDWSSFPACAGEFVDLRNQYFLDIPELKSDFYFLSVSYVAYWAVTGMVLLASSAVIKYKTPVDPSFILNDEHLNCFFKLTRLLDIWR